MARQTSASILRQSSWSIVLGGGAVLAPFEGGGIIAVIIIGFVMSPRPPV